MFTKSESPNAATGAWVDPRGRAPHDCRERPSDFDDDADRRLVPHDTNERTAGKPVCDRGEVFNPVDVLHRRKYRSST